MNLSPKCMLKIWLRLSLSLSLLGTPFSIAGNWSMQVFGIVWEGSKTSLNVLFFCLFQDAMGGNVTNSANEDPAIYQQAYNQGK